MITRELAEALAARGLEWAPSSGDRFLVPDRDLDDEVFVISGMSIEVAELEFGSEMRFNGTVEWALDSIARDEVIWLPREEQLRDALGERFLRLESVTGGFAVVLSAGSEVPSEAVGPAAAGVAPAEVRHVDIDAERAYARALLSVLP
ncbi:pilus assembly protein CpaE [Nocardioides panacis]|uniref:Pilus assembly protein CpaE n=1 Tax=Nocardioides panacis TaxID=2849501 RepID=A0A975SX99_9ACTN|nr:pilus assembly protein CpaE [Nocardioides panacis]QWZ07645.1 pilus assembly protein CpaE [Nocardioides panacis]